MIECSRTIAMRADWEYQLIWKPTLKYLATNINAGSQCECWILKVSPLSSNHYDALTRKKN